MSQTNENIDGKTILVVDDNRDAATTLGMLLKLKGYTPHTRFGGREALDSIGAVQPNLVILDLAMPDLDGYETAVLIREKHGTSLPLIALSGYGQDEDKRKAIEAGFDAHLVKPVNLVALIDLVNSLLADYAKNKSL